MELTNNAKKRIIEPGYDNEVAVSYNITISKTGQFTRRNYQLQ